MLLGSRFPSMMSPIAMAHSISSSLPPWQVIETVLPSVSTLSIVHLNRDVTIDTTWRNVRSFCTIVFSPPFPFFFRLVFGSIFLHKVCQDVMFCRVMKKSSKLNMLKMGNFYWQDILKQMATGVFMTPLQIKTQELY